MSLQYLSVPRYLEPKAYENSVERMLELLTREEAIKAIYRMGNVNHPGISDLDLIVVFENEAECLLDPTQHYTETDRYIFTHSLAGASESFFQRTNPYTFWDNLNCIWGNEVKDLVEVDASQIIQIKRQTALEFLFKNYIEISIQRAYGVIKLRSILQEIKAIRYDLAFLNITEGPLFDAVQEFLEMLDNWFENPFNAKEFENWLSEYRHILESTLIELASNKQFMFLPEMESYGYGKNVRIKKGDKLSCLLNGLSLPKTLLKRSKKWYNLNLRFNHFDCQLPFNHQDQDNLFKHRIQELQAYKHYNRKKLPHFDAMFSSFANQII
ncbi:MAG: hypothetical protein RIC95_13540 [Vicingaceae bacterium]